VTIQWLPPSLVRWSATWPALGAHDTTQPVIGSRKCTARTVASGEAGCQIDRHVLPPSSVNNKSWPVSAQPRSASIGAASRTPVDVSFVGGTDPAGFDSDALGLGETLAGCDGR